MTFDLRNIWTSSNKVLTTINLYLLAFIQSGMARSVKVKDPNEIKIPFIFNILILTSLIAITFLLVYVVFGGRLTIH